MDELFATYMYGQLEEALKDLEMPPSYYDKAMTAYKSVSEELTSEKSSLFRHEPSVILQGSIKIGTAIKPITEQGSYDVDMVCYLSKLKKSDLSQQRLKQMVGKEVILYSQRHGMSNDPHDGKRCWTLEYVDEANFHIDILPTVDDTYIRRMAIYLGGFNVADDARFMAHTDKRHPNYTGICDDWPTTNPEGFASWFMKAANYEEHRSKVAREKYASIEEIKVYSVKAPLQRYVQILKRHRDVFFDANNSLVAVRSIVITTLAGRSYEGISKKAGWYEDFVVTLEKMPSFITKTVDGYELFNPSDPLENFVQDWGEKEMRSFIEWHRAAMEELAPSPARGRKSFINRYARKELRNSLGLPEKGGVITRSISAVRSRVDSLSHHQQHGLTEIDAIKVSITARKTRNGGVSKSFQSGDPLPKDVSLSFEAHANGIERFDVEWQVTNDGSEALRANCLRGGFYPSMSLAGGRRTRTESTKYAGEHYVECLLKKDGVVYGRSEPFVVNIVGGQVGHTNW